MNSKKTTLIKKIYQNGINQIDSIMDWLETLNIDTVFDTANELVNSYLWSMNMLTTLQNKAEQERDAYRRSLKVANLLDKLYT